MRAATAHAAVGRGLRFDAPALVSREFRCVSTLPLWFRANSGRGHLGCGPQRRTRWGGAFVSTLPLWFCANSVAFRRLLCSPAVVSREFVAFRRSRCCGPQRRTRCGAFVSTLPLWFRANSGVFWPVLASSGGATWVAGRSGACGGAGPSFRRSRSCFFRGLFWPPLASSGPPHCLESTPAYFFFLMGPFPTAAQKEFLLVLLGV